MIRGAATIPRIAAFSSWRPRRLPLLLAALVALSSCQRGEARRPDVILVLVDTLRADRLGCYGNERRLTPFLDELAGRGTVFSRAYATSSWTLPSVASLFTARYPSQHHVNSFDAKLPEREVTLAERLREAGYRPAGFVANFQLEQALGYAQGFFDWNVYRAAGGIRADAMLPPLQRWLDRPWPDSPDRPRLLYLHYLDPHSPYEPPEPFRSRSLASGLSEEEARKLNDKLKKFDFGAVSPNEMDTLEALYDGEVASVDDSLRRTFAEFEKRGMLDHAIVVVTADHGEEFLEHGRFAHGYALYEESVRIPLIVVAPQVAAGRVVEQNVSLVDVAPTLLDLLDLPPQPSFEGRSLLPLMERGWKVRFRPRAEEEPRDVLIELPPTGSPLEQRGHSRALLSGPLKLAIALGGARKSEVPELYDLASDPGEMHPNPPGLDDAEDRLEASLQAMLGALAGRAGHDGERGALDEATKEKLRALGYAP